ncbi:MAG TPA: spore germination protein [Clostridiaceae bacterium]|jgi:gerA spore germination protein|nr:spore germination protein [Clostridiaceae bacterium]
MKAGHVQNEDGSNYNLDNNTTKDVEPQKIFTEIDKNLDFLKYKYNALICNDVIIREFSLLAQNIEYKAFVMYIDGMVDSPVINEFILSPLMMRNRANIFDDKQKKFVSEKKIDNVTLKNFKKSKEKNLVDFIYNSLIPQNSVDKVTDFSDVYSAINMGNCMLFVDSLNTAFNLDVKGFKQRSIDSPSNEVVVRGSQEAFVENIRTNTSMIRRLVNNENLVMETLTVGQITKTQVSIGYIKSLANEDLVAEVRYRINNLSVDYLISSGQLEQLIQDSPESLFPQMVATERPDKVSNFLLEGRVVIVVNGSPYVLVAPGVFVDFITSPEDLNLKYQFSNLEKIIRLLAIFLSLLLPGIYIAVTNYHQELIPTELLFTIAAARESVPFPTFVEILLMEVSFELIREAGLRVPTPLGSTIGIVGALILGEAAVSASLVSPVLIIIIAITGICSFSIPDFSLNFTFRIYRFVYIILGYMAGFLGISFGIFIQLAIMCKLKSFGSPYINPYILGKNKRSISSYFIPPIWKRERTSSFVHAQKKFSQQKISMVWRKK